MLSLLKAAQSQADLSRIRSEAARWSYLDGTTREFISSEAIRAKSDYEEFRDALQRQPDDTWPVETTEPCA